MQMMLNSFKWLEVLNLQMNTKTFVITVRKQVEQYVYKYIICIIIL